VSDFVVTANGDLVMHRVNFEAMAGRLPGYLGPATPFVSRVFRCQLVLMALGAYAYGDHVRDPRAFVQRCRSVWQLRGRLGSKIRGQLQNPTAVAESGLFSEALA
jgi:hypothetical protein